MNGKTPELTEIPTTDSEPGRLFAQLLADFPSLVGESVAYAGPPSGLFRATEIAQLPPSAQPAFRALGRLFWSLLQQVMAQQPGGRLTRGLPPLAELTEAVSDELRFAARALTIGTAAHQALGRAGSEPELEALAQRSLQRLGTLVRALEAKLPAIRAAAEVTSARRAS